MDKYCKNCGNKVSEDSHFCNECGSEVNTNDVSKSLINENNNIVNEEKRINDNPNKHKNSDPNNVPAWLIILIIIFICMFIYLYSSGQLGNSDYNQNEIPDSSELDEIEYQKITVDELMQKLNENAALAADTYNGQYLEITGKLTTIDSDLKYIGLDSINEIDIVGVHCNLNDIENKEKVKTLTSNQIITVRGKITDVGEILGYFLDVYEILT